MILREDLDRMKKTLSTKTERLILESKLIKQLNMVIKKLHDQVDMLTKQKEYLQSKLREKNGEKETEEKEKK